MAGEVVEKAARCGRRCARRSARPSAPGRSSIWRRTSRSTAAVPRRHRPAGHELERAPLLREARDSIPCRGRRATRSCAATGSPSLATTVGQQKLALRTALPSTGWKRKGNRRQVSGLRAPPRRSWMRHWLSAERKPQAPSARLRMRKWPAWPAIGSKGSRAVEDAAPGLTAPSSARLGLGGLVRVLGVPGGGTRASIPFDLGRGHRDVPSAPAASPALLAGEPLLGVMAEKGHGSESVYAARPR